MVSGLLLVLAEDVNVPAGLVCVVVSEIVLIYETELECRGNILAA